MTDNASPETAPQPPSEAGQTGAPPAPSPTASAPTTDIAESTAQTVEFTLDDIDQQLASIKALLGDELTGSPQPVQVVAPEPEKATPPEDVIDNACTASGNLQEIAAADLQEQPAASSEDFDALAALDAEVKAKPAAEPVQAPEPVAAAPARGLLPERCRVTCFQVLQGLALFLEILDKPFKKLGSRPKNVIGYVALATTAVGAATWLVGPLLLPH